MWVPIYNKKKREKKILFESESTHVFKQNPDNFSHSVRLEINVSHMWYVDLTSHRVYYICILHKTHFIIFESKLSLSSFITREWCLCNRHPQQHPCIRFNAVERNTHVMWIFIYFLFGFVLGNVENEMDLANVLKRMFIYRVCWLLIWTKWIS